MPTLTARDVWQGNPPNDQHQVPNEQATQLAEEMIADTAAVAVRATAVESRSGVLETRSTDLEVRAGVLEATQTSNQIVKSAWSDLLSVSGTLDGQGGEVLDSDTGLHSTASATGYDGASVANAGRYSWSDSWSRWVRIGGTGLTAKAEAVDLARVVERTTGIEYSESEILKLSSRLVSAVFQETQALWGVADENGNVALAITEGGRVVVGEILAEVGLRGERHFVEAGRTDWDFAIADEAGFVVFGIKDGAVFLPGVTSFDGSIASLDERNKSYSRALEGQPNLSVQLPTAIYNTVLNYGQSLGEGNETWPSLSKAPQPGALMIGDNVGNTAGGGTYTVIGTLALNLLVAHTHDGTSNLSDAEEAALNAGDQSKGEPPVIGLVNGLKAHLNRRALAENDGRNVVAISAAQAGRTIEQLSKDQSVDATDRFGLALDGVAKVETLAGSDSHVVTAVTWMQGEYNYYDVNSSSPVNLTRDGYRALMDTLFDDFSADISSATGQSAPPLFISYQTGATYTRDVDGAGSAGLHVGMAQLDCTLGREDAVMAGPIYPYTDKGAHLDANGSRWFGHLMAKVARKVLLEGKSWQPLRPLEIIASGKVLDVHFHVPVPPLRFAPAYQVNNGVTFDAKGFRVTSSDGTTSHPISSVEIIAGTVVRINLLSEPPSEALLWYADKTIHNGNGNLCDSDPEVAVDSYEYVPERGMHSSANIPELVGKPYPLQNWSVAFCHPITYSEI